MRVCVRARGYHHREIWNALLKVLLLPRLVELLYALDPNLRFRGMDVWIIFLRVSESFLKKIPSVEMMTVEVSWWYR